MMTALEWLLAVMVDLIKSEAFWVVIVCLILWNVGFARADSLVISIGVGTIGDRQLFDHSKQDVGDTPIGRAEISYAVNLNRHISLATTYQHFSSIPEDDKGFDWGGLELQLKF